MECPAQPLFKHSIATREGRSQPMDCAASQREMPVGTHPGLGRAPRDISLFGAHVAGQAFVVLTVTVRSSSATTIGGEL